MNAKERLEGIIEYIVPTGTYHSLTAEESENVVKDIRQALTELDKEESRKLKEKDLTNDK